MIMRELPDAPTLEVRIAQGELMRHNRWNAGYFEACFRRNERQLKRLRSVPLGNFIPERLPDGTKGITYGQVGARKLSPRGVVRYLQVINIRDTGIDFSVKPDRIADGSYNDPERSRVGSEDILFTNNAFRGTDTLIGRCIVLPRDYGKLNISQHIDRIRVVGINPFYVCCFLKSRFGSLQVRRVMHGVDAMTISFIRIRAIQIPPLPTSVQEEIERQYREMSRFHDRALQLRQWGKELGDRVRDGFPARGLGGVRRGTLWGGLGGGTTTSRPGDDGKPTNPRRSSWQRCATTNL